MSRKKKQVIARISILILLAAALFINQYGVTKDKPTSQRTLQSNVIEVHFIDVGQGDSILIESEDASMLIDAGENNKGSIVVDYLAAQNIKKLDYVIGTHPHSDHIGGLDTVIDAFPVETVIMPQVAHTTETFEDVLDTLDKKDMTVIKPVVGREYTLGPAAFTIVAPNSSTYEDLNNYSIVIRLSYGDSSFLLTADEESISEKEMLSNGYDLSADVLKLGHHGSAYSSTGDFLDAVHPAYAVISVGENNEYGHPHKETLQAVKGRNIKLYRTDKQGTVVFTTDGNTISVNTQEYEITETE